MQTIDLTTILRPSDRVFSVIHNCIKRVIAVDPNSEMPIIIGSVAGKAVPCKYNRFGSVLQNGADCLLFPPNKATTWEGYVPPVLFEQGDIVLAYNSPDEPQTIGIYHHHENGKHYLYANIHDGEIQLNAFDKCIRVQKKYSELFCKKIYQKRINRQ
jgi:hypothetical protein